MFKLNTSTSKYSINDKAWGWGEQNWCWSVLFRLRTRSSRWTRPGCRRSGWAASSSLASPRTRSSPALCRSHWNSWKYYCLVSIVCQHEVLFEYFRLKYCWTILTRKMNMKNRSSETHAFSIWESELKNWSSFFQLFKWMWRPIRNSKCCKF